MTGSRVPILTTADRVEVFFMPIKDRGQRLALHHRPAGEMARGAVVYVHPFAEEMNKSRRMAAIQSRAFADAGFAVVQIDLHGCGDSSGDFGEATWAGWVNDVVCAAKWLRARHRAPLWLWGLRAGCLLAVAAAEQLDDDHRLLFWQPATSGKLLLHQFLRLRVAADMYQANSKKTMERLRSDLATGHAVEIGGYLLAPDLAAGLEQSSLDPPAQSGHVIWLELSMRDDTTLLPASMFKIETWRAAGYDVHAGAIQGPAFWQTQEVEVVPALISASLTAMSEPLIA